MEEELMHYGVLGMKWGRRKARGNSGKPQVRVIRKKSNDNGKGNTKKQNQNKKSQSKPDVKKLSDEQLKAKVNRLNLEKRYSELSPKQKSKGRAFMDGITKNGKTIAEVTGTAIAIYNNYEKIKSILNMSAMLRRTPGSGGSR